jgi:TolB-like protein
LEILAVDLTEDITRELAFSPWFKVIAASTVASWRGRGADSAELAKETKARYVIEGKLQQTGGEVRLTLQIIDAETAGVISSHRFTRNASAVVALPEELPLAVASELREHICGLEHRRCLMKEGPLTGWEHLLRAGNQAMRGGFQGMAAALEDARKAVSLAPDLGFAHAYLAAVLGSDTLPDDDALNDIKRHEVQHHIKRALLLDGDNPMILLSLVGALAAQGDCEAGLRLAHRAAELAPGAPTTFFALGRANLIMGRISAAIDAFSRQLEIPYQGVERAAALQSLGIGLCIEGRLAEAEDAIGRALAVNPHFPLALCLKAVVAALQGQEPAARALIMQLREVEPDLSPEQHLRTVTNHPLLRERAQDLIATFHRLWAETVGR